MIKDLKIFRIFAILLTFVMLLGLTACGEAPETPSESTEVSAPEKHVMNPDYVAEKAAKYDHPDNDYFKIPDIYNMKTEGTRVIISNFETYQQVLGYTCGPSSAYMVLNHFDKEAAKDWDEKKIADYCGSTGGGVGTSAGQLANFFETALGWEVDYYMSHDKQFGDLTTFMEMLVKWNIDEGHPIIVDWCISSGHWTTIIGYDTMGTESNNDDVLIFADSGDGCDGYVDGYMVFGAQRFFSMWKESTPFDGKEVYRQQYVVAYPKGK